MAGTKAQVEGIAAFRASTLLASSSDILKSLDGIDTRPLADRSTCFVDENASQYRFDQAFVGPAAPPTSVAPVVGPGGWVRETFGGDGSPRLYDAVVDAAGMGDFLLPSAAFAAGARTVYVRHGTYVETANVIVPADGVLVGEDGAVLDLSGGFRVSAQPAAATSTSTGTISATTGSTAIVGVGTTFTALTVGDFIRLGAVFHEIASITDDTNLDLVEPYRGTPLSAEPFLARTMAVNVHIERLTLRGSTVGGSFRLLGVKNFTVRDVVVELSGAAGLSSLAVSQCTEGELLDCVVRDAPGAVGINLFDSTLIVLHGCLALNGAGRGMGTNECREILFSSCVASQNGERGFFLNNDFRVQLVNCMADENITNGIHADDQIQGAASCCRTRRNGTQGILMSESPNFRVVGCQSEDDAGVGIEARNEATIADCVVLNSGDIGICARASSVNVVIEGCRVIDSTLAGIDVESDDCVVNGCRVSGGTDGIFLDTGAAGAVVSGNVCSGGSGQGINVDAPDCVVDGNQVSGFTGNGLDLALGADRCIASNNRSRGNGGDGLSTAAASGVITSNQLLGNTGASLTDTGAGNIVDNNQV